MTRTEQQKARQWKAVDRARAQYVREYERRFLNALNSQIAPVIVAIKRGKETPENYILEITIQAVLKDLYEKVGLVFAQREYTALISQKSGKLTYSVKADEPQSQWMRFVRNWLGKEGAEKVQQITDTTKKFVKKVLDIGTDKGLSIDQMAQLMTDEANGINKYRAELIARTEIISSANLGSLEGARSTGLKLEKEWLSTRDKRTRESHIGVDGQIKPLDGLFLVNGNKLDYPGDSSHGADASETIQCRCSIAYNPL